MNSIQLDLRLSLSRMSGLEVAEVEELGGGCNSQVFKLTCRDNRKYIAKRYFRHNLDDRDRLGAEFFGLKFLWENEVRAIPRPITADIEHGYGFYEYIEGMKIFSPEVSEADIVQVVEFLESLECLKYFPGSGLLPPASEACFSVQGIIDNIQGRINRFFAVPSLPDSYSSLFAFINHDFLPTFRKITEWCKSMHHKADLSFSQTIPLEERTISPSDFGFHNALRAADGAIIFLDFEYFGWDDPAKMVSDFLLHPAMQLTTGLKRLFVAHILKKFAVRHLAIRLEIVYPLFGLKWCMILLNEFLQEHWQRRQFAGRGKGDRAAYQEKQLSKAKKMLTMIQGEYENFPYHP
jgi:hypothetical protein